jgi:hypothetical protein
MTADNASRQSLRGSYDAPHRGGVVVVNQDTVYIGGRDVFSVATDAAALTAALPRLEELPLPAGGLRMRFARKPVLMRGDGNLNGWRAP